MKRQHPDNPDAGHVTKRMSQLCHICGEKRRYTWNSSGIFGFHACYDCYSNRPSPDVEYEIEKELKKNINKVGTYFNKVDKYYELHELKREYVRKTRESHGFVDPMIKCRKCKETKSIFEFPDLGEYVRACYRCEYEATYKKVCPGCSRKFDYDAFEDDEYEYKYCPICREQIKVVEFIKQQTFLENVSDAECIRALKLRNIGQSPDAIKSIRCLLIAKRINKILKHDSRREKYESDYAYVYGKQPEDEKDITGRIQTR